MGLIGGRLILTIVYNRLYLLNFTSVYMTRKLNFENISLNCMLFSIL